MFSSITNMPLFGLQACGRSYQIITNTNVVGNSIPIFTNKRRYCFKAITITPEE